MDDSTLERLQLKAGVENRYQITILIIAFLFHVYGSMMQVSLPFLEKSSSIYIYDQANRNITEVSFDYDYCNKTLGTTYQFKRVILNSWMHEYDIHCDKAKTGLIGSVTFLGLLIGSFLYAFIADKWGRRVTIIIAAMSCKTVLLLFNFSFSLYYIYVMVFILQVFSMFIVLGSFNYSAEISSKKRRALYGAIITAGDAFAAILFAVLYKFIDNWRWIFNICGCLYLITGVFYFLFSVESPHYYFVKGKPKRINKSLKYIAQVNGREALMNDLSEIKSSDDESGNLINEIKSETPSSIVSQETVDLIDKYTIFSLIKYPSVRYNFLVMNLVWFTTTGMYFSILIFLKKLSGDLYINGMIFGALDVFCCLFGGLIIETEAFGRKRSQIILCAMCAVCSFVFFFTENSTFQLSLAIVIWFCVAAVYTITFVYSSEVYPITLSAKGLGINSLFGKFSSVVLPFALEYLENDIFLFFAVLNVLCTVSLFWITETCGKQMELDVREEISQDEYLNKMNTSKMF